MTAGLATSRHDGRFVIRNPVFLFALGFVLFPAWLLIPLGGASSIAYTDMVIVFSAFLFATRRTVGMPLVGYAYIAYLVAALLAGFLHILAGNTNSAAPMAQVVRAFAIFFPFWIVFLLPRFDAEMLRRVVHVASIGGAIAVFAGILIFELGIQVHEVERRLWLGNGQGYVLRAGGVAGHSGSYGMLLAVWATVLFIVRPALGMHLPIWVALICAAAIAHGFQTSSSRGGLLQVLVAIALYAALILPSRPGRALLALGVATAFGAVAVLLIAGAIDDNPALARSVARLDLFNITGQSAFFQTVRLSSWTLLPQLISENWIIGAGFKQFFNTYGFYIDNAYLLSFFESGLIAFAFFMLFWGGLVVHGFALMVGGNIYARLFLIVLIPFMVRLLTGGANTNWSVAPIVFLLVAALYRMALQTHAAQRQRTAS